jgi:serine/threonine protein kinase
MRALLHARNNHPSKSNLLRSLLSLLSTHNVDMQATIDIDDTLQQLLIHSAHETDVNDQLISNLLEQYGLLPPLDPTGTNTWQQQSDNDATIDRLDPSLPKTPTVSKRTTSVTPSLTHIINNSPRASVWSANDPILDRQIVLKEYDDTSNDRESQTHNETRFLREAQITGQLEHPNIIPVYAVSWNKDGNPYYTMKHVDGDTLTECLESYHLNNTKHTIRSLRPLLDIFANVCRAISYAHSRGVIHRDIKPSNIAIGSYGEVMVIDWGLGTLPPPNSDPLSSTANNAPTTDLESAETVPVNYHDTPNYMSPEQTTNDTVTRLTDVYSLGGVLFSILTGQPPHINTLESSPLTESFNTAGNRDFPPVDNITPYGPIQLVAMVNKAMHCNPERRYQDVVSLLADLQAVMVDKSIAVCPDTVIRASTRWIRKHPILASIACTILTLGLISLSVSNFIIDKSNEQVRVLLSNSQILTREAKLLRNELTAQHSAEAVSKESALRSHKIAIRQQEISDEQAKLANSARTVASRQLELAIKSSMTAQLAATRANQAKGDAYAALETTKLLKNKVLQFATVIRAERVRQLTTHARHLIDLDRRGEAILPLVTALTMPDNDSIHDVDGLRLANSLIDQSVSLTNIELTDYFSTNYLKPSQLNISSALSCLSFNPAEISYQLIYLPPNPRNQDFKTVIRDVTDIPTAVLHNHQNDTLVVVIAQPNGTSISVYPADPSKPPISFAIGVRVTSAILSTSRNQIIVGTHTGGGYSFDLANGTSNSILSDVGVPITALAIHGNSSIAAFATASRVHIVDDPLGDSNTVKSIQLSNIAAALHFNSPNSLVVVTSRGYVNEYTQLPNAVRRIRFRPPVNGSELRNVSIHPSGVMLLDHSSNHLTLLRKNLAETTVQSPHTISVRAMNFSSDGQFVLTTTDRRITTIWECSSMQPRNIPMQSDHLVIAMELDMPNQCLYTLHSDRSLRTWQLPQTNKLAPANNTAQKYTAESTLERFQLMLTIRPSENNLAITAAQAMKYLAEDHRSAK